MWPSLVGHCVRDAGVARSNRAIPTISVMRIVYPIRGRPFLMASRLLTHHRCHLENRQVHGNNHPSDNTPQKYHHERFQ